MQFRATALPGVFEVRPQPIADERGHFARTWCAAEFHRHGLNPHVEQINTGFSHRRGTLRGLHYQAAPHAEAKLVRCTRGAIYDVALDLRPGSPTYRSWHGAVLTAANGAMLYLPEGCAHGYQTLTDAAEISYTTSVAYAPAAASGVRHDDPAFGIEWPLPVAVISATDRAWPDFIASWPTLNSASHVS